MHPAPMWPVNGHYQCPVCLRSYPVPWEEGTQMEASLRPAAEAVNGSAMATAASH